MTGQTGSPADRTLRFNTNTGKPVSESIKTLTSLNFMLIFMRTADILFFTWMRIIEKSLLNPPDMLCIETGIKSHPDMFSSTTINAQSIRILIIRIQTPLG